VLLNRSLFSLFSIVCVNINIVLKVVSSIVADMDLNNEGDKEYFTELMQMFITYIRRETLDDSNLHIRNSQREIVIIIMRFIGMSKTNFFKKTFLMIPYIF